MINPLEKFKCGNDRCDKLESSEKQNIWVHEIKFDKDSPSIRMIYEENLHRVQNHLQIKVQECKEKDEEIERLKKELKEKDNEEELWTLKYIYDVDGVVKEYEQNGMLKEDAEELIGMDSDNWNHFSLTKEERPDKDKIIEGLLIRCESNEELIEDLKGINETLANKLNKVKNDNRLKIGLSDRRA